MIRHWGTTLQAVPWLVLAVLSAATIALARARSSRVVAAVRVIASFTVAASVFGIAEHVKANFDAGPLDAVYGPKWDTLSTTAKWWDALIKRVGPSPTLAPGVLAQIGLCLLFASLHHPALHRSSATHAGQGLVRVRADPTSGSFGNDRTR